MATVSPSPRGVLTVNAESSSLKFAFFLSGLSLVRTLVGKIECIGLPEATLTVTEVASQHTQQHGLKAADHAARIQPLVEALERQANFAPRGWEALPHTSQNESKNGDLINAILILRGEPGSGPQRANLLVMSLKDVLAQRREASMEHQHNTGAATAAPERSTMAIERQGGQSPGHIRRKRPRPISRLVISAHARAFRKRFFPTATLHIPIEPAHG
jgi:hypothetical protein